MIKLKKGGWLQYGGLLPNNIARTTCMLPYGGMVLPSMHGMSSSGVKCSQPFDSSGGAFLPLHMMWTRVPLP